MQILTKVKQSDTVFTIVIIVMYSLSFISSLAGNFTPTKTDHSSNSSNTLISCFTCTDKSLLLSGRAEKAEENKCFSLISWISYSLLLHLIPVSSSLSSIRALMWGFGIANASYQTER